MIVVTGVTGRIGGAVATELRQRGVEFRACVRDERRAPNGAEVVIADFSDRSTLPRALKGATQLLLIVPDEHVELGEGVVDVAASCGVERVVRISAIACNDRSNSELLRLHAKGERLLEQSGMGYAHLRCNSFFQNVNAMAPWISRGAIFWCGGGGPVAWVDARDVGRAATAVLLNKAANREAFELTGPEALTWADIAASLEAAAGSPVQACRVSESRFIAEGVATGWDEWTAREWAAMFVGEYGDGGTTARVSPDLADLTGTPPTSFSQFCTSQTLEGIAE